jgi:hypothetical protein
MINLRNGRMVSAGFYFQFFYDFSFQTMCPNYDGLFDSFVFTVLFGKNFDVNDIDKIEDEEIFKKSVELGLHPIKLEQDLSFNESKTLTSATNPSNSDSSESSDTQESKGKHRAIANTQINLK